MIHLLNRNDEIIDNLVIPSAKKEYWASKMTEGVTDNLLTFDFTTLQDIAFDNVFKVLAQDQDSNHRLFLVREVIKSQTDFTQDVKTDGEHILLKKSKPILPFTILNATVAQVAERVLEGLNYEVGTVEFNGVQDFILQQVVTPLDAIQQIRDTFSCTVKFRVQVARDGSIQRFVDFLQPKEIFNGKEIVFTKDMTDLIRDEDRSSLVTHMMGVTYDQDKNLVTLADVNNGSDFVIDEAAFQRWNINGQPIYGIHEYQPEQTTIDENNGEIDLQKFLAATQEAARLVNDAIVAYQVGSAALETIPGLEHEKMRLYDQVRIKDEKFSPALFLTAQVQQTEMPELDDKSGDFTFQFGDFQIIKSVIEQQLRALQSNVNFNKNSWNGASNKANLAQQLAGSAQEIADAAQQTADGKSTIVASPTPPTDTTTYWIDTSDPDKPGILKHFDESKGEFIQDSITQFTDMLGEVINKQIADGAVTVEKLLVDELSAIAENVGHLKGGIIEGVQIIGSEVDSVSDDGNNRVTLFDGTITSFNGDARIVDIDELGVNIYDVTDALVGGLRWASSGDLNGLGVRAAQDFMSLGFALDTDGITSSDWMFFDNTAFTAALYGSNNPNSNDGALALRSTALGGAANGMVPGIDILHATQGDTTFRNVVVQTNVDTQRPGEQGFNTGFEVWQYMGQGNGVNNQLLKIDTDDSTRLSYTILNTDRVFAKSGNPFVGGLALVPSVIIDASVGGTDLGDMITPGIFFGKISVTVPPNTLTTVQPITFDLASEIYAVFITGTGSNSNAYLMTPFNIDGQGWETRIRRSDLGAAVGSVNLQYQYIVVYKPI